MKRQIASGIGGNYYRLDDNEAEALKVEKGSKLMWNGEAYYIAPPTRAYRAHLQPVMFPERRRKWIAEESLEKVLSREFMARMEESAICAECVKPVSFFRGGIPGWTTGQFKEIEKRGTRFYHISCLA